MGLQKGKEVDFRIVADIEEYRDYFDSAIDLGVLEKYRKKIEEAQDLERLRPILEKESPLFLPGLE